MDAITSLVEDHTKVKRLFEGLEESPAQQRDKLFKEIALELTVHSEIEEQLFYPAVKDAQQTHDIVLESLEEHKQVKKVLADLSESDKSTEHWLAGFKVLKEDVLHHVKEEEEKLFPLVRSKILSKEELKDLGRSMEGMKKLEMAKTKREA